MKTRFLSLLVVVALAAGAIAIAEDKAAAPALKCPVSGKAVAADKSVDFNGGKVQFCCENCQKSFQADTAKFAAKANFQLAQSGQLKQTACPMTGKPCDAEKTVDVSGISVQFCCGGCKAKADKASGDDLVELIFKDISKGWAIAKK